MRKLILVLAVVFALVVSAIPVFAQVPTPSGPFTSAFTIQNLTSTAANCVFSLYNSTGVSAYSSASIAVSASGSYFVYVGNISGLASGQYSGVISCDQQVAAVANTTGPSSAAAYMGLNSGSATQTSYAPGIYKNYYGYYSNVVVQNTTSAAVSATLHIYSGATEVLAVTKSVNANAAVAFDQNNATDFGSLAAGLYSGKVTATGAVVGVVNIWNAQGQFFEYSPFTAGGPQAYVPVLMNNYYGFNTALTVQNLDPVNTAPVTVTYSTGKQSTFTIAGGGSHLFYTPNEGLANGFLGSATIQSGGGAVVALVNESSNTNRADSYAGFTQGFNTASAPIVLKTYYQYSTSITCQNVGGATTTITANYSNGTHDQVSVGTGQNALFFQPNSAGLPAGFNGSAAISSSPASPIVCVVNENQVSTAASQDWLLAYDAIGQ
jgi:hypothetical protein